MQPFLLPDSVKKTFWQVQVMHVNFAGCFVPRVAHQPRFYIKEAQGFISLDDRWRNLTVVSLHTRG